MIQHRGQYYEAQGWQLGCGPEDDPSHRKAWADSQTDNLQTFVEEVCALIESVEPSHGNAEQMRLGVTCVQLLDHAMNRYPEHTDELNSIKGRLGEQMFGISREWLKSHGHGPPEKERT